MNLELIEDESGEAKPFEQDAHESLLDLLFLWLFGGCFGLHRFHLRRHWSGALMFLTLGGLGLWWIIDGILICSGRIRNSDGERVTAWAPVYTVSSPSNKFIVLTFALLTGLFGFHRFYLKRYITGTLMLITLGGLGIWWALDVFLILLNDLEDGRELPVNDWRAGDLHSYTVSLITAFLGFVLVLLFIQQALSLLVRTEGEQPLGRYQKMVQETLRKIPDLSKLIPKWPKRGSSDDSKVYRYRDKNGVTHYVDSKAKVPAAYRNQIEDTDSLPKITKGSDFFQKPKQSRRQ